MKQGWTYINGSPKWHYFQVADGDGGGRSICGKFLGLCIVDDLKDANDDSVDNCAACKKIVKKMRETVNVPN